MFNVVDVTTLACVSVGNLLSLYLLFSFIRLVMKT